MFAAALPLPMPPIIVRRHAADVACHAAAADAITPPPMPIACHFKMRYALYYGAAAMP